MWRSYTRWRVARIARQDGRRYRWVFWPFQREAKDPMPPDGSQERASFEETLCQAAEADMQELAKEWQIEDEKLFPEYCRAFHYAKTLEERLQKEGKEADEASDAYKTARETFQALDPPPMGRLTAALILSGIAITELVFNAVVFEIFMRERWETYLMGLLPLLIPYLGDWVGGTLRQEKRPLKEELLMVLACAVAIAGTLGIAWIRSSYLAANEIPEILHIPLTPRAFSLIFVTFNAILFVAAIIIGYMSTPKDRHAYAKARRDLQDAIKKLAKETGEAEQCARELERAQVRLREVQVRRETRFRWYQERAKAIKEEHDFLVGVYREENTRARGGKKPPAFDLPFLEPALPKALQGLNWDCNTPEQQVQSGAQNSRAQG